MKAYLFLPLLLCACAGYKKPLCDEGNFSDMANLEGKFSTTISMVQEDKSEVIRQTIVVNRIDKGRYLTQSDSPSTGNGVIHLCEIDGHTYVEGDASTTNFLPNTNAAFLLEPNGDGSFDFGLLGADTAVLKARGIPFEIRETKSKRDGEGEQKSYTLLIDNTSLSASEFVQLLDPLSIKITWLPEAR